MQTLKPRIAAVGNRRPAFQHTDDGRKLSPSKRGYGRRWEAARDAFLRVHPLCQCRECDEGRKLVTPAEVVDHVIPHRGNMRLFWDYLNWQAMAKRCHDKKTWRESLGDGREFEELRMPSDLAPSRIQLTIVCGPPGGGKSTYVRENAGPNDVVIDLDQIMQRISGLPEHHTNKQWLDEALAERNKQLRALARDTTHARAWFIIAAPNPRERALWVRNMGAALKVMAPPLDECVRRINADPTRAGHTERMIEAATDWWSRN